jgi:hypothetical protein
LEEENMEKQKLFDYELSEEMRIYLKEVSEQIKSKKGLLYEKLSSEEVDSTHAGYQMAIDAGYDLDGEEFERVANDSIKLSELIKENDGELDLEMLEMVAGGMEDSAIMGIAGGTFGGVIVGVFFLTGM